MLYEELSPPLKTAACQYCQLKKVKTKARNKTQLKFQIAECSPNPVTHTFSLAIFYAVIYVLFAYVPSQIKHKLYKGETIFVFVHHTKLKTVNTELIKAWLAAKGQRITRIYKPEGNYLLERVDFAQI